MTASHRPAVVGGKYRLKQKGKNTDQRFSNLDYLYIRHTGPISIWLEAPNPRSFEVAPRTDGKSMRKARFAHTEVPPQRVWKPSSCVQCEHIGLGFANREIYLRPP